MSREDVETPFTTANGTINTKYVYKTKYVYIN